VESSNYEQTDELTNEFVPFEYLDSDSDFEFPILEESNVSIYEKVIAKASSIDGIRKFYHIFKEKRRDILKDQNKELSQ
jgi:hypothetical protein